MYDPSKDEKIVTDADLKVIKIVAGTALALWVAAILGMHYWPELKVFFAGGLTALKGWV